ncbi:hypothetical protein MUK71_05305 [Arthrobacter zhangbolii]|uniref:MalT-like TPR region domain-containing protein n=1 Tax=Arthrobacter zhangbolii TaxID=2886936 RepID=A0A9X1M7K2_9MICC|nr:hypothetical protein [Arthrobacter zhangbolii]MCC3272993.1 hypothetical protein [Arthrobacter zhangbolii]UON93042.1 hypothetical protein MUK71_05305 [Arthrobacter zhangbolii]
MDSKKVFILNEYRAQQAQERRDYVEAIEYSHCAVQAAVEGNDDWGYCRMMFNVATLQYELGYLDESAVTTRALVASDAVASYPDLQAKAKVLLSRALQNKGDMEAALSVALDASEEADDHGSLEVRLSSQHGLVAALAEEGDLEAAWKEALNLSEMARGDCSPKVAGLANWTIGNVGFMAGKDREGVKYHQLASQALASINDVTQWGLFNKASAHMRLFAGLLESDTLECIERAEVALGITGAGESDLLELEITRAWWELETGNPNKADELLIPIEAKVAGPYPFLLGRTLQLRARCLDALGQEAAAMECAQKSERIFTEVGAEVLAADSRKIRDALGQSAR